MKYVTQGHFTVWHCQVNNTTCSALAEALKTKLGY